MLATLAITASLSLPGCATVGLRCRERDRSCLSVRRHLEVARAQAGEPENAELVNARMEVTRIGQPAVPYLVQALDDGEPGVAAFAARSLIEMGREDEVTRWCQGNTGNTDIFCSARGQPARR